MTQEDEQIDSRPKYDVKIDRSQGVVIGDYARVEQHFHDVPPAPIIDLVAAEAQYRQWVVDRYNWLGFAGFEQADLMLTEVPLTKVFVRLSLTVEKVVPVAGEEHKSESDGRAEGKRERAEVRGWEIIEAESSQGGVSGRRAKGEEEKEEQQRQERIVKVQEPVTLVKALKKNVLLVGEPGAGKSTLLRWLAVTFAQRQQRATDRLGPEADADRLPVYVELGRLPEVYLRGDGGRAPAWSKLLPELIAEQEAFDNAATVVLTQALADGQCLVLCDGLDEVADRTARGRIAQSLVEFARRPAGNRVVIGSRPAGMAETESSIRPGFECCQIERFAPAEVQQFFRFWYQLDTALSLEAQTASADELFARLEHMPGTMKLATTPLLATILLLTWRNEGSLPARRVEVYERCCKMLVENWERHHNVQYVGALANLGWQRHLRLLAPLAYTIHSREQRTSASLQELVPVLAQGLIKEALCLEEKTANLEAEQFLAALGLRSGLLQRLGPDEYGFAHLTFQEYLAARHIGDQRYPDYIDLFMSHLHEGWWREVHLLTMGHLGSDEEGGKKASQLILEILNYNPPPRRILRPSRYALVRLIELGKWLPSLQWQRRLAWLLGRDLELIASGCLEMVPEIITKQAQTALDLRAGEFVIESFHDEVRLSVGQEAAPVLGQASPAVVEALARTLRDDDSYVRRAADSLGKLGQTSPAAVEALVRALGDSHSYVRRAAADSLGKLGQTSPAVAEALLRNLGDRDWVVRLAAANSLGELGQASPAIVETLVRALGDDYSHVRWAVADSLVQLGQASPAVAKALIRDLSDDDSDVRQAVAASLGKLVQASPVVAEVMVRNLGDRDSYVWWAAADSLGKLGQASPAAVEALIRALGDSHSDVRGAAAECLVKLGQASPAAVEALVRALGDDDSDVWWAAADSLGKLGQASPAAADALVGALGDDNLDVRRAAAYILGQLGQASPAVAEALVCALGDDDSYVRRAAAYSLGQLGQVSPVVVATLARTLGDSNSYVRGAAAYSLGELGQASPAVVEALVRALGDSDWDVRWAAAGGLGKLGQASPAVAEALVRALGDDDWGVRWVAAESLGQLGQASPVVVEALVRALGDDDSAVRRVAAESLGQLGQASPVVAEALVRTLGDDDLWVRRTAAESMGTLGQASPVVVKALVRALGENDSILRCVAANSLGQLGQASPAVVAALASALGDDDSDVRRAAGNNLGKLAQTSPTVVEALVRALGDDDSDVRRVAAYNLGELGQTSPAVVEALVRALGDSDFYVRRVAADGLGQLGQASPAVAATLASALGDNNSDVRQAATDSLVKLGQASPVVAEALVRALGDSDSDVRWAAAYILGQLGQTLPAVVEALARALGDSSWDVRWTAASSLGKLRDLGEDELSRALLALLRLIHDTKSDLQRIALESTQALLAGRPIPEHPRQKLQDRIARRRKRLMIARLLAIGAAVVVLPALLMLLQEQLGADSRPVSYLMAFVVVIGVFAAAAQILGYVDQRRASSAGNTPDKR